MPSIFMYDYDDYDDYDDWVDMEREDEELEWELWNDDEYLGDAEEFFIDGDEW